MPGTSRLSNQAASAATAPVATPVVLVELDFATGPFRVWTGLGPLDWAGKVFEGAGSIGAISDVEETVELRAVRLIRPLMGTMKVPSVTREDVESFMHKIAEGATKKREKSGKKRGVSHGGCGMGRGLGDLRGDDGGSDTSAAPVN